MSLAVAEIARAARGARAAARRESAARDRARARRDIAARRPRFAVIAARGSSDNAARYAQHLFGRFWGMPVALATPSLHTLYDAPPRLSSTRS